MTLQAFWLMLGENHGNAWSVTLFLLKNMKSVGLQACWLILGEIMENAWNVTLFLLKNMNSVTLRTFSLILGENHDTCAWTPNKVFLQIIVVEICYWQLG